MRIILTLCLVLFIGPVLAHAQEIPDEVKRAFSELQPNKIDVDGDGRADTIQPRVYAVVQNCGKGKHLKFTDIKHWIEFDLTLARGRKIPSIFKYEYGTSESTYWVYALISAGDINRDGKTDLVFYSGDDTSDETITLVNRGIRFIVHSRKRGRSEDAPKHRF